MRVFVFLPHNRFYLPIASEKGCKAMCIYYNVLYYIIPVGDCFARPAFNCSNRPLISSSCLPFFNFWSIYITDHLFLHHKQPKIFMINIHPLIMLYLTHEVKLYRSTWETSSNFPTEWILSPSPTPLSPHLVWWFSTVLNTNWMFDNHTKAFNTGNFWALRFLWDSSANPTQLRPLRNQPPQWFFREYNCLYITSQSCNGGSPQLSVL